MSVTGQPVPLPIDFVVMGVPVSQQTRNRARRDRWKAEVRKQAAAAVSNATPSTEDVEVTIVYFHDSESTPDVDNIIKPVQDGLSGTVIDDDTQVQDVRSARRSLHGAFKVNETAQQVLVRFGAEHRGAEPDLARPRTARCREFLHCDDGRRRAPR